MEEKSASSFNNANLVIGEKEIMLLKAALVHDAFLKQVQNYKATSFLMAFSNATSNRTEEDNKAESMGYCNENCVVAMSFVEGALFKQFLEFEAVEYFFDKNSMHSDLAKRIDDILELGCEIITGGKTHYNDMNCKQSVLTFFERSYADAIVNDICDSYDSFQESRDRRSKTIKMDYLGERRKPLVAPDPTQRALAL